MPSVYFPANGICPKCGAVIRLSRIEPHHTKPEAYHYFDCAKCGEVLVKVFDLRTKPPKE
jgi:hypothetical protein